MCTGSDVSRLCEAAPEDQPFFACVNPAAPHEPAIPAVRHQGVFAEEKATRSPSFDEEDVLVQISGSVQEDVAERYGEACEGCKAWRQAQVSACFAT